MSGYSLRYAVAALKDLRALDRPVSRRIVKKTEYYILTGRPLEFAKPLTGSLSGLFRFRMGDYRVIFRVDGADSVQVLNVLRVKHRREIYA